MNFNRCRSNTATLTLHTDGWINATTKRCGYTTSVQSQRLEKLTELLRQLYTGSFFGHNHTSSQTCQINVALLQHLYGIAQRFCAQFNNAIRTECVPNAILGKCTEPKTGIGFNFVWCDQDRMMTAVDTDQCPHCKAETTVWV